MTHAERLRALTIDALCEMRSPPMVDDRYRSPTSIYLMAEAEGDFRDFMRALDELVESGACIAKRATHQASGGYRWHGAMYQEMRREAAETMRARAVEAMQAGDIDMAHEHTRKAQLLSAQAAYEDVQS